MIPSASASGFYQGVLETIDGQDWIRVDLTEGQTVQIDLCGSDFNPVETTHLRLYDGDGVLMAFDDGGGDILK